MKKKEEKKKKKISGWGGGKEKKKKKRNPNRICLERFADAVGRQDPLLQLADAIPWQICEASRSTGAVSHPVADGLLI
ncbi:MAG: hypothetical protein IPJ05_01260 [Nitrosomonas sp.]|nr:hypothetical protein [Nitrosomonas sp.]